jgi:hypothetical protein
MLAAVLASAQLVHLAVGLHDGARQFSVEHANKAGAIPAIPHPDSAGQTIAAHVAKNGFDCLVWNISCVLY